MDRGGLGLDFLLAGMGLGVALMTFVVTFDSTAWYQTTIAPTVTEAMHPLGYVLDAAAGLSFVMSLAGIACVSGVPNATGAAAPGSRTSASDRLAEFRRRKEERARRARVSRSSHGST